MKTNVKDCTRFVPNFEGTDRCDRCRGKATNHRPAAFKLSDKQFEVLHFLKRTRGAYISRGFLGSVWLGAKDGLDFDRSITWRTFIALEQRGLIKRTRKERGFSQNEHHRISAFGRLVLKFNDKLVLLRSR